VSAAHWSDALVPLGAYCEGLAWARTQPDLATAWRTCTRGDWMGWLLERGPRPEPGSAEHRRLVGCSAAIAREALPIFEAAHPDDSRVRDCLDVCDRFSRGEATVADLQAAWAAEDAARAAAWTTAARTAAGDAAWAAWAAGDAATAWAAEDAAGAAGAASLARSADIIREWYPTPPALEGLSHE